MYSTRNLSSLELLCRCIYQASIHGSFNLYISIIVWIYCRREASLLVYHKMDDAACAGAKYFDRK